MKYCFNCGANVTEKMKFCSECGTALIMKSAPSSNEEMNVEVKQCPQCGEIIPANEVVCMKCGFDMEEMNDLVNVREFFHNIEMASNEKQILRLISLFELPASKNGMLQFLEQGINQIEASSNISIFHAWEAQLFICTQRAKSLAGGVQDSKDFLRKTELYENKLQQQHYRKIEEEVSDSQNHQTGIMSLISVIGRNPGIVGAIILFIAAIRVDMSRGNSSVLELTGAVVLIMCACVLVRRKSPLIDFAVVGLGGIVTMSLSTYLDNGSALELGGGVTLIITVINYFRSLGKRQKDK